mgnify:CR=1 FL=1
MKTRNVKVEFHQYQKSVWLVVAGLIVLLGLLFLSGCTSLLDSATNQSSLTFRCQHANHLYTNLENSEQERQYFLPSGEQCSLQTVEAQS